MGNNVERDDLFTDIVNRNTNAINRQEMEKRRFDSEFEMLERAVQRSIKCDDAKCEVVRNIEMAEEKQKKKKKKLGVILTSVALVLAIGLGIGVNKLIKSWDKYKQVSAAVSSVTEDVRSDLLVKGMATLDYDRANNSASEVPFQVFDNSVNDYKNLGVSSDDIVTIYAYKATLNSTEFDDFMKAVTGMSFDEYLKSNGYSSEYEFDEKAREASFVLISGRKGR